jgi:hypothetical protein
MLPHGADIGKILLKYQDWCSRAHRGMNFIMDHSEWVMIHAACAIV